MNAPIADTIKAEAAKSLLERMAEKTKLVRFFRYNASAKHGVPIDAEEPINFPAPTEPAPVAPTTPVAPITPSIPITIEPKIIQPIVQNGIGDQLKGVLATLAALAVIGASIWSGLAIGKSKEPVTPAQPVTTNSIYRESPFQYLEDKGEHLP